MRIVDTNIILRYVLRDLEEVYAEVKAILEETEVFIPLEIVAEVVYVLEKVYKTARQDIRRMLETLCAYENLTFHEQDVVLETLVFYCDENIDFIDAVLCAYRKVKNADIHSFDKRLKKVLQRIS